MKALQIGRHLIGGVILVVAVIFWVIGLGLFAAGSEVYGTLDQPIIKIV